MLDFFSALIREKRVRRIVINPADYGRVLSAGDPRLQIVAHGTSGLCATFENVSLVLDKDVLPGYVDMITDTGRKLSGQL